MAAQPSPEPFVARPELRLVPAPDGPEVDPALKPCRACGGPKVDCVRNGHLCGPCRDERAARKVCRGCGGSKEGSPRGARYCPSCRLARQACCQRCGGEKPPGQGRRLCASCEPRGNSYRKPIPCQRCGGEKPPERGRRLCADCSEIAADAARAKARARSAMRRRPCERCGGRKPPMARRYCEGCRDQAHVERRGGLCRGCGERPARAPKKHYCEECNRYAERRRRARAARSAERFRQQNPERVRAQRRARRKRSPEDRDRLREADRMTSRLRAEREGRTVNEAIAAAKTKPLRQKARNGRKGSGLVVDQESPGTVDIEPFRAWLKPIAGRLGVAEAAKLLGVADRQVRWWSDGEAKDAPKRINLDSVDGALCMAGEPWMLHTLYPI